MHHFFLALMGLWQTLSPQTAISEQEILLEKGQTTIQTDSAWNFIIIHTQSETQPVLHYRTQDRWYPVQWTHDHENTRDKNLHISKGIFFDDDSFVLHLRSDTQQHLKIQFLNTKNDTENLSVQAGITDFDTGIQFQDFSFDDALLDGVEMTQFQNGMAMGSFQNSSFRPQYITREGWGADESLRLWKRGQTLSKYFRSTPPEAKAHLSQEEWPEITEKTNEKGARLTWPVEQNKSIKKVVLHHTGEYIDNTTQMRRTPRDHIRAIYQYHTINKDWGDIGYNFIIDKLGNIYEGRYGGPQTVGAHTAYHNVGTVGIALMGNFEHEEPTDNQIKVLSILLAYLSDKYGIDPEGAIDFLGIETETITGHRFVARQGHGTACPGTNLIKRFPDLRSSTNTILKKLRSQRDDMPKGLDFLSKSSGAQSIQRRLPRFEKKEKLPLITQSGLLPKTILQRGSTQMISVSFQNNSQKTWDPHSTILPITPPPGIQITPFKSEKEIAPNEEGVFTALISVTNTANGHYDLTLDPVFLKDSYFEHQKRPIFKIPIQISGDRNLLKLPQKTTIIQNNNRHAASATSFSSAQRQAHEPEVKIKIKKADNKTLYFRSDKALFIRSNNDLVTELRKGESVKISIHSPRTLEVKTAKAQWVLDDVSLHTEGYTEIINYNRGINTQIPYNKFRRQLNIHPQAGNKLLVVNQLPLEEYLSGLAEEPASEPEQKKHAIHILARSYVYVYNGDRRKFRTHLYDLEDDPATSQFYLGYDWERFNLEQKRLLTQTKGMVITYKGIPVIGPYFTQSSGHSSDKWNRAYPWAKAQPLPFDEGLEAKGHGVGLSGNSARELAREGKNYKEIIDYFFTDINIKKIY